MLIAYEKAIEAGIESFVAPIFQAIASKLKMDFQVEYNRFTEGFKDYLIAEYQSLSEVSTIVNVAKDKSLQDIYLPLMIHPKREYAKYMVGDHTLFLTHTKHIKRNKLIIDSAGMGKSTILKMAFLNCIEDKSAIPIFVELRKLSKDHTLIDEIVKKFSPIYIREEKEYICKCLEKSKLLFLFDGYDEISFSNRVIVSEQILEFTSRYNNNYFVLTSRPEPALESFSSYQQFTIRPLLKDESYEILRKYDSSGETSSKLISQLEKLENQNIEDFLQNPLLTSLLFTAFDYKNVIPLKKHLFYRQVYDSLFETHDLSKSGGFTREKKTQLGIDDMHQVLRCLGYISYISDSTIYSKDEVLELIARVNAFFPLLKFKHSDLLHDIHRSVPLIGRDGIYYKWKHKSLQEYFAAQFIFLDTELKKKSILIAILEDKKNFHGNLLDIYFSIDTKGLNRYLVKPYIESIIDSYDRSKIDYRKVTDPDMQLRLKLCASCYYRITHNISEDKVKFSDDTVYGYISHNESFHKIAKFQLAQYDIIIKSKYPQLFEDGEAYKDYILDYKDTEVNDEKGIELDIIISDQSYVRGEELKEGNARVLRIANKFEGHPNKSVSSTDIVNLKALEPILKIIDEDLGAIDLFDFKI